MSCWIYIKPEPTHVRGLCVLCQKNHQKSAGKDKYRPLCSPCDKRRYLKVYRYRQPAYNRLKKDVCSRCGFVPIHRCQLDVHHVDHNHYNNHPDNLETLCANCHRLEHRQKESPEDL